MKTFMAKTAEVERQWYVIDAQNQVLGRLAAEVAAILRGKHKPIYTNEEIGRASCRERV